MKKISLYLLISLILSLLLSSCDDTVWIWDSAETKKQKINEQAESDKRTLLILENLKLFSSSEAIALIAVKYDIDERKVFELYRSYIKKEVEIKSQSMDELLKDTNEIQSNEISYNNSFSKLLDELSSTYHIDKRKLSSIIIDLKLLNDTKS